LSCIANSCPAFSCPVTWSAIFMSWNFMFGIFSQPLNSSARVIFDGDTRHHVTPLLRDHLHWLRARERISFKVLRIGVQGNTRPCTLLSERNVHSSFDCSQPFCSPFRCSWWFGRIQKKATTRQPGWSGRLEQSTTGHSFGTYIINVQKHAQDTSVLSFLLHWLTVSRVRAPNIVRRHCSDCNHVNAPYKFSFYYYYYYNYWSPMRQRSVKGVKITLQFRRGPCISNNVDTVSPWSFLTPHFSIIKNNNNILLRKSKLWIFFPKTT